MAQDERAEESGDYARELARFAADLTTLRIEQGNPSLTDISRRAPGSRSLSPSAISEALGGRRLPGIDFLMALVKTLLLLGEHRPPAEDDPRLDRWRQRWRELQRLKTDERRSRLAAPPAATPASEQDPLRCFVAMPGESMGAAAWDDIPAIRKQLLEPVARAIGVLIGRDVKLILEKEKTRPGVIHSSMFGEARDAELYIADLTGANPNVYLELGVRWATRDNVTIVICQDLDEVKFNPRVVRVIPYSRDAVEESIQRIAEAAADGLENAEHVDSPVRHAAPAVTLSRAELDSMRQERADMTAELARLREQLAEDLLEAAHSTTSSRRKVLLLELAVDRNPASWQAHYELGSIFRREGRHHEAVQALRFATELRPGHAPAWRELGTALGKIPGSAQEATVAFERALELDDRDAETWATQGGLLRRMARSRTSGTLDQELLDRALTCYRRAAELSPNNLYPLMNEARIMLLLAGLRRTGTAAIRDRLGQLEHLARFAAYNDSADPWVAFDLADTLILTGRSEEGLAELRRAAALCPAEERTATLKTVAEPMNDLLAVAEVLDPEVAAAVRAAVETCKNLAFLD
ncbi:tetratricopeptide repeat protein [Actinoplanes sp. NBC_00393]|uniref:tetratricopeptide repeat protein n=1 Tax=Actinoplanes sp. NBC_00393 TaxID=2975953 RepID=UPI002E1E9256